MSNQRQKYFDSTAKGQKTTYDKWMREVFFHPMGDGLRLGNAGLKLFKKHFSYHVVDSNPGPGHRTSGHYIFLARFCREPYHIGSEAITFFDDEEAFLFKLCDGDVDNVKDVAPEKLK